VESSTGIRAFAARATANETLAMFRQSVLTYLPIVPNTSPKEGTGERDADRPRQAGIEVADGHDRSDVPAARHDGPCRHGRLGRLAVEELPADDDEDHRHYYVRTAPKAVSR